MDFENIYKGMGEVDLGEKVIQLQEEKGKLLQHVRKLEDDVERLCQEIIKMKREKDALSKNISELFNTAKREIDRKNETINQLREELDDICFRRNRAPYNGPRNMNNRFNEVKCEPLKEQKSHSKSPQHFEKEKTKSKTPVRQRSRSSSYSKNYHKRDNDKNKSPNWHRSRSRSPHRFKRRRSPSPGNHHGSRSKRSPLQRRRSRSREYHSRGHKREQHHSLNPIYRHKKQNMRSCNHQTYSREVESDRNREISDQRINDASKHYLLQEFEDLYNEDIDRETDPSPFVDRTPFLGVKQVQNKSDGNRNADSVLAEIYKKSESLFSEGTSSMVVDTLKKIQKDCDSNEYCLETPSSIKEIITKDSFSFDQVVTDTEPNFTSTSECKIENSNSSSFENLKNEENKNCSPVTATQVPQQSIGRRRRRCVLKIKE